MMVFGEEFTSQGVKEKKRNQGEASLKKKKKTLGCLRNFWGKDTG